MIPSHQIAELNDRLRIDAVAGDYVRLQRRGRRFVGLCPFHTEKTPSFTVTPERNLFYCFGCQKGGSMLDLVMELEKLSFPEAFRLLAERAGMQVEETAGSEGSERQSYLELYRRLADSFRHILVRTAAAAPAREHLANRGFSAESLDRYRVGYAPRDRDWLLRFLRSHHYGDEFLARSGLFTSTAGGMLALFRDRIVFPISTPRGEVVAFGGRAMGDGPKYLNTPETAYYHKGELLYGLAEARERIKQAGAVHVAEGYLDVIALDAAGQAAVAPLGTALSGDHARLLARYTTDVRLVMDSDAAGANATRRAISTLEDRELSTSVVPLQAGLDPADYIQQNAGDRLQTALASPILAFRYLLKLATSALDLRQADAKEQVFRELLPYLTHVRSELKREALLHDVADLLEVGHDSIVRDYRRHASMGAGRRDFQAARTAAPSGGRAAVRRSLEMTYMLAAAANRDRFDRVQRRLQSDDLQDPMALELFVALDECARQGDESPDGLLGRLQTEELRALVIRNLSQREFTVNPDEVLDDGARKLKARALERRRRDIEARMRRAERGGDEEPGASVRELLEEKIYLDSELEKLKKVRVDVGPVD
ncbi:MAG: DNA primase [Spirochaetaceae bacterium]|nr:DNA primase [Spirochaetaceae bacterium]